MSGGAGDVARDGGRAGGRRKVGIRELEGSWKGGRWEERRGRTEGGRREGGGEAEGRNNVGVRELEGRKLGGGGGREEI